MPVSTECAAALLSFRYPSYIYIDSLGFWVPNRGFRIPGSGFWILCQWHLDSSFQSLVGFRIPWAVFQIPKPRIADFLTLGDEFSNFAARVTDDTHPWKAFRDCQLGTPLIITKWHETNFWNFRLDHTSHVMVSCFRRLTCFFLFTGRSYSTA